MTVFRCYVEKKAEFAIEAQGVKNDLMLALRTNRIENVRIINRYDIENIDAEDYEIIKQTILSEPQVDVVYDENLPEPAKNEWVFAMEYLPGQFDQRADSCAQCIQLATCKQRPTVQSAKVFYIAGVLGDDDKRHILDTLINPVEAREASLDKKDTLQQNYEKPPLPEVLDGFIEYSEDELKTFINENGLAMDLADITFLQSYFKEEEKRNPTITEIKVIDTYWSDHCRHTTFSTIVEDVNIDTDYIKETYDEYLQLRKVVYEGKDRPITLMDLATIGAKALKKAGQLKDLDESEEINACSVNIEVKTDAGKKEWLLMFKNETHNHPTEIEPFGGAATCLGGAIRDPLSGRSYVYQAMRVTGASDPTVPVNETMRGKLPQRKIVTTAAQGYSSYGNQIGLATGYVHEIYHPGYVAKRMEIGAVIAAAPKENVVRERPEPGDIVILLGGKTGRDGCGGATGSSKAHNVESLDKCGAEVQKGNAPEERKLQRLFRNPTATKMIKRCNDFGAGGVSVAIGELADGLYIDLNKVPRKYEGLDGTELAISESQERMAVVVRKEDADAFVELAREENLEATIVAEVKEDPRMIMNLDGTEIVNLSRTFLNSNGAKKYTNVHIPETIVEKEDNFWSMKEKFEAVVDDINMASQKGLVDRFDSTIGAGTLIMPYGGKWQLTPAQAMAAKIPALGKESKTASLMTYGFDPFLSEKSPYHGAMMAVISSVAKMIAAGGSSEKIWLTFQEYFGRVNDDPQRWGKPFAALLGALKAQIELGIGSIGGKDSMSGSFEDIDVPPTLVSFAVSVADTSRVITDEWKESGHNIYYICPEYDEKELPNWDSIREVLNRMETLIKENKVLSAWTLDSGGIAEGLVKCAMGNQIGFSLDRAFDTDLLFDACYGAFVFESDEEIPNMTKLGETIDEYYLDIQGARISLNVLQQEYEGKLQSVYPYLSKENDKLETISYEAEDELHASYTVERPHVLIPVFPGTNCEYDTARAFENAGGETEIFIVRNQTSEEIEDSANRFVEAIQRSQIIAIPGGFSGGDEPDGSGKFITSFLRNPEIKDAIHELLDEREGLMCGICNGFQALVKLGLVPYGHITDPDENAPTLTFNTIGRHQSMIVRTRVASNKSPWFKYMNVGDVHTVAISHGEGRFIANEDVIEELKENGQIATQYVDLEDNPTNNTRFNPNNSVLSIEGITSKDGRIFGKMGHSERYGEDLYKNIPDLNTQEVFFKGAIDYFK